jgi:hypothetical protein
VDYLLTHIVLPLVSTVLGLVATIVVPVMTARGVKYLNRRWKLDIDERESHQLERLASDVVHLAEAQLGAGGGKAKLAAAMRGLGGRAAQIGVDVGEDVARAKIEKALRGMR